MTRCRALLVVAGLCGAVAALSGQRFSSGVEAVRVDVLVTIDGQPVLGLDARDFEVRDNGVLQVVDFVSFDQVPLNVVLALDSSGSLTEARLNDLRGAAYSLLGGLKDADRAALVTFSHIVVQHSGLTTDLARLRDALDAAYGLGETALFDAAYAGIIAAESDLGRPILVMFTDGVDTASWLGEATVIDIARRSDVVVYSVSIGAQEQPFLRDLGRATGGRTFALESTRTLEPTFRAILEEFRHRYLLRYSPQGTQKQGWHDLDVRVKRRNAVVKARPGYHVGS